MDPVRTNATLHFIQEKLRQSSLEFSLTLSRLHLEGHNVLVSFRFKSYTNTSDQIQIREIKWIASTKHESYEDRPQHLWLFSLNYKRIWGDLIISFNIFSTPRHNDKSILPEHHHYAPRCNRQKITHQGADDYVGSHFFSLRIAHIWNASSTKKITTPSVDSFERRIDKSAVTNRLPFPSWASYAWCTSHESLRWPLPHINSYLISVFPLIHLFTSSYTLPIS